MKQLILMLILRTIIPLNISSVRLDYQETLKLKGKWNLRKIAIPLRYLSNFWRSLEMPWINCNVELKLK